MQWFRFYNRTLNNPKAQRLSGDMFKHWVNLLCVTSQCDGKIVTCDISYHLRVTEDAAASIMETLVKQDLMVLEDGYYVPKDWEEMQYKSDTSAERTRRYREKKKTVTCDVTDTVTVTPPDTEQIQIRTEIKKNTKKKSSGVERPSDVMPEVWEDFIKHRKAKRATVTNTVIDNFRSEAAKAGWTLEQAIKESCARGWQGFKAEWVNKRGYPQQQPMTKAQAHDRGIMQGTLEVIRKLDEQERQQYQEGMFNE